MAGEIVERIVQGEAVVPQDDVPLFPAYAAGELGLGHVFVEKIDEGPAFLWRPVGEARGEHAVEVDSFRTRIRVAAHYRVGGGLGRVIGAAGAIVAVNGLETAKAGLHTRAERLEGRDGAGKCRVPTGGGNRQRVQDRYVSAGLAKSDIRVPVAPSEQALAVGLLSHFQHFGNTLGMNDAVVGVVTEQWAEVCDEIPQCHGTQVLLGQDKN